MEVRGRGATFRLEVMKVFRLTSLDIKLRHVSGRKLPLAAGNTPINCSKGLN